MGTWSGGHSRNRGWASRVPRMGSQQTPNGDGSWVGIPGIVDWGGPRAPGGHPKVPPVGTRSGGHPRHSKQAPKAPQVGTRHIPNMNRDRVGTTNIQDGGTQGSQAPSGFHAGALRSQVGTQSTPKGLPDPPGTPTPPQMGVPDCPDTPHTLKNTLSAPKGGPVIPPQTPHTL